jgi:hypothetical protein
MPSLGLGLGLGLQGNASGGGGARSPFSKFAYDINFAAGTTVGAVPQTYGNNTQDGRPFRDSGNFTACYLEDANGLLVLQASSGMRRTTKGTGLWTNASIINLWSADLTQAAWVATSVTAAKNQTGADGVANAASSITATGANGTIKQSITSASADRVLAFRIKRLVGSGALDVSIDNEVTWNSVTTTASYTRTTVFQLAVTNPSITFRIGTSGDSFAVDFIMMHGPLNSQNVATGYEVRSVGTAFGSIGRSTPWALNTDSSPLYPMMSSPWAVYWEGGGDRIGSGGLTVSDGGFQIALTTNGAVTTQGVTGAVNQWFNGPTSINRVVTFCTGSSVSICVNGGPVTTAAGTLGAAGTHFVLASNGSGGQAIGGFVRRYAMTTNVVFTNAEMQSMTAVPGTAVFSDDFSTYANTAALTAGSPGAWTAGGSTPVVTLGSSPARIHVENGDAVGSAWASRAFTTVVGQTYYVSGNVTAINTPFLRIVAGASLGGSGNAFSVSATGIFQYSFIATATTSYITINTNSTTLAASGDVTSLVVK